MESLTESVPPVVAAAAGRVSPLKEGKRSPGTPPSTSSARPDSPPPDCVICLGECRNKSFTDSCLHQFCYDCLVAWSKVKPECPLCKQRFKTIIYNVKSNHQYDQYLVEQNPPPPTVEDFLEVDYFDARRFRYRTTLTLDRQEGLALERLLLRYPLMPLSAPPPQPQPSSYMSRRSLQFRQTVYRDNLWAMPLPDITNRYRDCSPEFYRQNPAQMHRLVPWINRELTALLPDYMSAASTVINIIPRFPINSVGFRQAMLPHLGSYTDHFIHELFSFASSPFDVLGYDRSVQYRRQTRIQPVYDHVISDDENSNDSDIVILPSPTVISPASQPSPYTPPNEPSTSNRRLGSLSNSVIAIETMSHSDTDDSSDEVIMVGYIKPPHERTPEVVNLIASDSDAVVIDDSRMMSPIEVVDEQSMPGPPATCTLPVSSSSSHPSNEQPSTSGLVKLSLKRNNNSHIHSPDTDSDDDVVLHKRAKRMKMKVKKQRYTSRDSASTECTDRDTDTSDADYVPPTLFRHSDDSESSSDSDSESEPRAKSLKKQFLASKILKNLKRNARKQHHSMRSSNGDNSSVKIEFFDSENDACSSQTPCSSPSTSRRKSHRKSKHKKRSYNSELPSSSCVENQKLKFKSGSKSKERLITKIFENKQAKNSKKRSMKSKAKNKCFVKSNSRSTVQINSPSTSKACTKFMQNSNHHSSDSESEAQPEKKSNVFVQEASQDTNSSLLDIVSKSILTPNNSVLSINNESSQQSSSNLSNDLPHNMVTSLLNRLNDNFFICQISPDLRPPNNSSANSDNLPE